MAKWKYNTQEFALRDSLVITDCVHKAWFMIKSPSGLASHRNETTDLPTVLQTAREGWDLIGHLSYYNSSITNLFFY